MPPNQGAQQVVDDETGLHGLHFKMSASGLAALFLLHLLLAFVFHTGGKFVRQQHLSFQQVVKNKSVFF